MRRTKSAAKTSAFQRCGRGGKPQRIWNVLFFRDGERESAMENIAGAERIHSVHRESGSLLQVLVLVEPDRAQPTPSSR